MSHLELSREEFQRAATKDVPVINTENSTPLPYQKFSAWISPSRENPVAGPYWYKFYLKVCKKKPSFKDENLIWVEFIRNIMPGIWDDLMKKQKQYEDEYKKYQKLVAENKFASNLIPPEKIFFFKEIEPIMYQVYLAVCFIVDSDKVLL